MIVACQNIVQIMEVERYEQFSAQMIPIPKPLTNYNDLSLILRNIYDFLTLR